MESLQQTVATLVAKTQDILQRSERAWSAACQAWNEDPNTPREETRKRDASAAEKKAGNKTKRKPGKKARIGPVAKVTIDPIEKALERALITEAEASKDASRLTLWTDASAGPQRTTAAAGSAAVFQHGCTWVRIMALTPNFDHTQLDELQAINHALEYAEQQVMQKTLGVNLRSVEIFTDCQAMLIDLRRGDLPKVKPNGRRRNGTMAYRSLFAAVKLRVHRLERAGLDLEFHWVPRNKAVGNVLAHQGAGLAKMQRTGLNSPGSVLIEIMAAEDNHRIPVPHMTTSALRERMAQEVAAMLALPAKPSPALTEDVSHQAIGVSSILPASKELQQE
ncbi:nadph2 dehydrogenase [Fusarium albosuccineum]|uniref:Nadph2 dehydrogenase n=1 Tax=Fusarium albosuccineum TaxID=1237068 RepID=A0A8H4LM20_9HYPO|nr:nadph2 dehydrogenase [Fusarium albosuccineum]